MTHKVEFRGNGHTNKSSRDGHKPISIVNHVVAGSGQSCDNWFRSPNNEVGSAHYCVWEDGRITQYVGIEHMAWANGLAKDAISRAKSSLVKSKPGINPNKYTVSIEHAGHTGKLTEAQFEATVWLHKHIQSEVKKVYGVTIPFDRTHILGHFEIDPVRKPNCPGPDFPWSKLMKALGGTSTKETSTSTSGDVKSLQQKLIKAGYKLPKYGADGSLGDETVQAVKQFQKDNGLTVDGIAGPKTLAKLDAVLTSSSKVYHTVKKGDTVSSIAKKHKVSLATIKLLNKLDAKFTIKVGQKLRIK
jgi:N-acetylmuramoyl-L-alanine amidase